MSDYVDSGSAYPAWVGQISGLAGVDVANKSSAAEITQVTEGPTIRDLVRKYVLTIFNLGLFSLIILQLLFQKPFDALVSAVLILVGISINVGQELWARRRLAQITSSRRESITVVRDSIIQEINLQQMVVDDIMLSRQEDLIAADGVVVNAEDFAVDESLITDSSKPQVKQTGDRVYAGSICLAGVAAVQVHALPQHSLAYKKLQQIEYHPQEFSPLQRLIDRVLRALIVIVTYFGVLLVLDYALVGANLLNHSSMAAMIFGLAPNGLFFMIILSYTMGVTMISSRGALIPNITDIESLAQVSVLCLGRTQSMTHVNIDIENLSHHFGNQGLSDAELQQLLADCALNNSSPHPFIQELADSLPGKQRAISSIIPFSMESGWSALVFADDPSHMVYIIGLDEILEPYLADDYQAVTETKSGPGRFGRASNLVELIGGMFQRPRKASRKVASMLMYGKQVELMLAFVPGTELQYEQGIGALPDGLIPLGRIQLSEEIRQDAKEMVHFFNQAGVKIKILSDERPQETLEFARHIGIALESNQIDDVIRGSILEGLEKKAFNQLVKDKSMFSRLSNEQKGAVVQALRDEKEFVGMLGSSLTDLMALQNANMWITPEAGSQAIRRFANIVLLKNSLATLRFVFREGERIINGLSDVFRVYLTQIFYFAILIITIGILDLGFPLSGKQNSAVTLVTVHIPAMALSIFAVPGKTPRGKLVDMLFHFIVPAGILTSIAGFSVYFYFLVSSSDLVYAQLAMTHVLVFCGALTILFVEPPLPIFAGGDIYRGNKWPALVVIVLVLIFLILSPTWLGKELFDLKPLGGFLDYLIILGTAALYGLVLKSFWRFQIFDRYMRIDLEDSLEEPLISVDMST